MVIFPGDMVNGWFYISTPYADQFATWRKAMAPVYDAGITVYPVRGNHENGPSTPPYYFRWPPGSGPEPTILPDAGLMTASLDAFLIHGFRPTGQPEKSGLCMAIPRRSGSGIPTDHEVEIAIDWQRSQCLDNGGYA